MQLPPATGHSKTFVVPLDAAPAVGRKDCLTLHVPGPVNPPPAPHVSKSKLNGALIPLPEASSTRWPASTVIVTFCVTVVFKGTFPNGTLDGLALPARAEDGSRKAASTAAKTIP